MIVGGMQSDIKQPGVITKPLGNTCLDNQSSQSTDNHTPPSRIKHAETQAKSSTTSNERPAILTDVGAPARRSSPWTRPISDSYFGTSTRPIVTQEPLSSPPDSARSIQFHIPASARSDALSPKTTDPQSLVSSAYLSSRQLQKSRDVAPDPPNEETEILDAQLGVSEGYGSTSTSANAAGQDVLKPGGPSTQQSAPDKRRENGTAHPATDGSAAPSRDPSRVAAWWASVVEKYGAVELENKGSVARDHLAIERTFLAWLRTSLSFASIGIAVTQLFRLNTSLSSSKPSFHTQPAFNPLTQSPAYHRGPPATILFDDRDTNRLRSIGKPLGATFLAISILILFLGSHRYFESQHYVIQGKFPASRGSVMIVSVVACALIVASLVIILSVAPGIFV